MSIESLKLDLINWISTLDEFTILEKINAFKTKSKSGWDSLSYEDQHAIEEGLNHLNEGQFVSYSDMRKEIDSLLNLK